MSGIIFYVPLGMATTPSEGHAYVDRWWSVHPGKGLAFYCDPRWARSMGYEPSPQCNADKLVTEDINRRLYPDHEVLKIPTVFAAHARTAMKEALAEAGPLPRRKPRVYPAGGMDGQNTGSGRFA